MRFRLIGVLGCLLMMAPVAGFARTSSPFVQEAPAATSAKHSKKKKAAHKKQAKKHAAKKGKKKGQKGEKPGSGR
jgi:hypothetical protein